MSVCVCVCVSECSQTLQEHHIHYKNITCPAPPTLTRARERKRDFLTSQIETHRDTKRYIETQALNVSSYVQIFLVLQKFIKDTTIDTHLLDNNITICKYYNL